MSAICHRAGPARRIPCKVVTAAVCASAMAALLGTAGPAAAADAHPCARPR
jgi:hypothetical protein